MKAAARTEDGGITVGFALVSLGAAWVGQFGVVAMGVAPAYLCVAGIVLGCGALGWIEFETMRWAAGEPSVLGEPATADRV